MHAPLLSNCDVEPANAYSSWEMVFFKGKEQKTKYWINNRSFFSVRDHAEYGIQCQYKQQEMVT